MRADIWLRYLLMTLTVIVVSMFISTTPVKAISACDRDEYQALRFVEPIDFVPNGSGNQYMGPSGSDGNIWTTRHPGIDYNGIGAGNADEGQVVRAIADGIVVTAQDSGGAYGNVVMIEHCYPDGTKFWSQYAHLQRIDATANTWVHAGIQIGTLGRSGLGTNGSAHLHFEIRTSENSATAWPTGEQPNDLRFDYANPTSFVQFNYLANHIRLFDHSFYIRLTDVPDYYVYAPNSEDNPYNPNPYHYTNEEILDNWGASTGLMLEEQRVVINVPSFMNDKASSVAIPEGWLVELCANPNGQSPCITKRRSDPDLSNDRYDGWIPVDNNVSSVAITRSFYCWDLAIDGILWTDADLCQGANRIYKTQPGSYPAPGFTPHALYVHPDWSVLVSQGSSRRCINRIMWDLQGDYFPGSNTNLANPNPYQVFHDPFCGRQDLDGNGTIDQLTTVNACNDLAYSGVMILGNIDCKGKFKAIPIGQEFYLGNIFAMKSTFVSPGRSVKFVGPNGLNRCLNQHVTNMDTTFFSANSGVSLSRAVYAKAYGNDSCQLAPGQEVFVIPQVGFASIGTSTTINPVYPNSDWKIDYFNNPNANGTPCHISGFNGSYVLLDWHESDPDSPAQPYDPFPNYSEDCNANFSARIWRDVYFPGGIYTFYAFGDDNYHLEVLGADLGNQIIDHRWYNPSSTQHIESRYIPPGNHGVNVMVRDNAGEARLQVWWTGPGFPALPHQTQDPSQWFSAYWGNLNQREDAIFTQNEGSDDSLNRYWGSKWPQVNIWSGVPGNSNNKFSTKFERDVDFACGRYRFYFDVDDTGILTIDPDVSPVLYQRAINVANSGGYGDIIYIPAGTHKVQVKQSEHGGGAKIELHWQLVEACALPPNIQAPPEATANPTPTPGQTGNGLSYQYYEITGLEQLPQFGNHTPVATGTVSNFTLPSGHRYDDFAYRFTGCLEVPESGLYTFSTTSDDGSAMYLNGQQVVNNDGLHAPQARSGNISLTAGLHAIEVTFFERGGGEELTVQWQGPGISGIETIPAARLYLSGCATPSTPTPSPTPTSTPMPTPTPTGQPGTWTEVIEDFEDGSGSWLIGGEAVCLVAEPIPGGDPNNQAAAMCFNASSGYAQTNRTDDWSDVSTVQVTLNNTTDPAQCSLFVGTGNYIWHESTAQAVTPGQGIYQYPLTGWVTNLQSVVYYGIKCYTSATTEQKVYLDDITLVHQSASPTPTPTSCGSLAQEAESGQVAGTMQVLTDAGASGGQAVGAVDGSPSYWSMDAAHRVTYCVTVTQPGTYRINAWTIAPDENHDSFWVQVDSGSVYRWFVPNSTTYQPSYVGDMDGFSPVEIALSSGNHTLSFYVREPGTKLDRWQLELQAATAAAAASGSPASPASPQITYVVRGQLAQFANPGLVNQITVHDSTGKTYTAYLSPLGEYVFEQLPLGTYTLVVHYTDGSQVKSSSMRVDGNMFLTGTPVLLPQRMYLPVIFR